MPKGVIYEIGETGEPVRAVLGQAPELVIEQHIKVLSALINLSILKPENIVGAVEIRYVDDMIREEMKYINETSPLRKIIGG